jgi:hypothetical protein
MKLSWIYHNLQQGVSLVGKLEPDIITRGADKGNQLSWLYLDADSSQNWDIWAIGVRKVNFIQFEMAAPDILSGD